MFSTCCANKWGAWKGMGSRDPHYHCHHLGLQSDREFGSTPSCCLGLLSGKESSSPLLLLSCCFGLQIIN